MKAYSTPILVLANLMFLATPPAQAQLYTANPNSTFLNIYYNDGTTSSITAPGLDGTVSPYSPLETAKAFNSTGIGKPLQGYDSSSWLQAPGTSYPGNTLANTSLAFPPSPATPSATVQYFQQSLWGGSNIVENSSTVVSPQGTVLYLNKTSSGIAELRLDWVTTYTYTGPTPYTAGPYTVGEMVSDQNGNAEMCVTAGTSSGSLTAGNWPGNPASGQTTSGDGVTWMIIPTYVPTGLTLDLAGTVASSGDFIAVTGQEEFTDLTSFKTTLVQIPWAGDFVNSSSVPWASGFLDKGVLGTFPGVFGSDTQGTVFDTIGLPGLPLPVQDQDQVMVSGYLDLFVDPASAQLEIVREVPNTLGITNTAKGPVVYFPILTPTNHTLQMSTNLVTGNWTTVTNGTPTTVTNASGAIYGGLLFTNKAQAAFFRLH